jgi:hypothetical protein
MQDGGKRDKTTYLSFIRLDNVEFLSFPGVRPPSAFTADTRAR